MTLVLDLVVFVGVASLILALSPHLPPVGRTARPRQAKRSDLVKKVDRSPAILLKFQDRLFRGRAPSDTVDLRRDLAFVGFDAPLAPLLFVVGRAALTVGLPLLWLMRPAGGSDSALGLQAWLIPLCLSTFGFLAPWLFVTSRARERREEIAREFPDALDLITLCVDAGVGLEAAFIRVGEAMRQSHPGVGPLIARLGNDWNAGRGRSEALRAMAERAGVDAVSTFVDLVVQADSLGAPIVELLRIQAHDLREYRRLAAEEKAIRAPVLMTLPMVVLLLPITFGAVMLPAIIDLIRRFGVIGHAMSQGAP